ncbi:MULTISPECIES: UxaA family hydrolase [Fusobacterium]|uniref:UxaA family hydrolase n=1 Tax=Fusobacterium TaxID=848 RepID=UPI00197ED5BA|nr:MULTISPECIES: UxaA family hydrolase [Fusobacterium]
MKRSMLMNEKDDGVTVLENVECGDIVGIYDHHNKLIGEIKAQERIPFGNKICLRDKNVGDIIYKYGEPIGEATKFIQRGKLIHVHNVKSLSVDIPEVCKKEIIRQMGIEVE